MPILRLFLEICLFRKGPQDVPASTLLLTLCLIVYFAVGLTLLGQEMSIAIAALEVLVEGGILVGFAAATLNIAGMQGRLLQTLVALVGTDVIITSLAIPVRISMEMAEFRLPGSLIMLMLMLWSLSIMAHILRHALSRPFALAFALAIVYIVANFQIMPLLFHPQAG